MRNESVSVKQENKYITQVHRLVVDELSGENVAIALFGSMSTGMSHNGSDIDIGIMPKGNWNSGRLSFLRQILEDSNIPYKVDLIDFSMASEAFKQHALSNAVWWRM
jgi:uncharacterized protein